MPDHPKARKVYFTAFAAGVLAAVGCNQSAVPPPADTPAPAVGVVHAQRKALKRVVEQPGTIQAYEEAQLFARVPGYVRLFHHSEGRIAHDIGQKIRGPK